MFVDDLNDTKISPELYHSKLDAINDNYERVKKLVPADNIIYEKITGDKL